jgi:hypothetical protein
MLPSDGNEILVDPNLSRSCGADTTFHDCPAHSFQPSQNPGTLEKMRILLRARSSFDEFLLVIMAISSDRGSGNPGLRCESEKKAKMFVKTFSADRGPPKSRKIHPIVARVVRLSATIAVAIVRMYTRASIRTMRCIHNHPTVNSHNITHQYPNTLLGVFPPYLWHLKML